MTDADRLEQLRRQLELTLKQYTESVRAGIKDCDRIADLEQQLVGAREDADKAWGQARGATETRDRLQRDYNALEQERAADEARAQEIIGAVRRGAEIRVTIAAETVHQMERERDAAKNLLAAANERAEMLESENEELQRHPECGACGMVGTREAVLAHIQDCEKHPIHALKSSLSASEARCRELRWELERVVRAVQESVGRMPNGSIPEPVGPLEEELSDACVSARAVLAQQGQDAALSNIDLASRRTADTGSRRDRHAPSGLEESEPGSAVVSRTGPRSPVPTPQPRRTQEGCNKLPTGESPKESRQVGEPGQRDERLAAADVGGSTGEVIAGSADPQRTAVLNLGGQGSPVQSHGDNPDPAAKPRSVGGGHDRSGKSPGTGNVAEPQLGPDSAPCAESLPSISDPPAPEQGKTDGKEGNHG